MSSYYIKAKNKETGEVVKFAAIDDYFGKHHYGYAPQYEFGEKPYPPEVVYTQDDFENLFEI